MDEEKKLMIWEFCVQFQLLCTIRRLFMCSSRSFNEVSTEMNFTICARASTQNPDIQFSISVNAYDTMYPQSLVPQWNWYMLPFEQQDLEPVWGLFFQPKTWIYINLESLKKAKEEGNREDGMDVQHFSSMISSHKVLRLFLSHLNEAIVNIITGDLVWLSQVLEQENF